MLIDDFVCTYKRISDEEESDELWRQQFLQAVGSPGAYNDQIISDTMEEAYALIQTTNNGKMFLELAWEIGLAHPMNVFITRDRRDHNMDIILIQAYFGWATMDLFHRLLIKLKRGDVVEWNEWQTILDTYRTHKK
jgi:hypothetical protein